MNILEKNELYESARNLMWVMEIIEDSIDQELKKQKTKNKNGKKRRATIRRNDPLD